MQTSNFGSLGLAAIDETAGTVLLTVPPSQSVTSLAPTFTLSANATINPAAGSTQNFTNPAVYQVTAENGTTFKDYTVSVQTFAAWTYSGSMFTYTAPRITGNDSATIQFKAVFATGTQPIDVPLTVLDTVPDPAFTLVPSTSSWDGRQTMTVTANISNLAAMQSAGFGTLNYKWSVTGVAVIKQESGGTLTLTRSQGSGPMTVALTIDNGGPPHF
jgi:hypothetical protein